MINDQSVDSFFEEMKAIDRQAVLDDMRKEAGAVQFLQKGLGQIGKLWNTGGKGLQTAYRGGVRTAAKGAGGVKNLGGAGKVWGGVKGVAKQYAPAATVAGAGGLATYGAGKAVFGGNRSY